MKVDKTAAEVLDMFSASAQSIARAKEIASGLKTANTHTLPVPLFEEEGPQGAVSDRKDNLIVICSFVLEGTEYYFGIPTT